MGLSAFNKHFSKVEERDKPSLSQQKEEKNDIRDENQRHRNNTKPSKKEKTST